MTISIVIATYNRAERLAVCLEHLAGQSFAPGDEVVVADNGSTDHTQEVLRLAAARLPAPLRVVRETRPGKSAAVAAALREVTGEILAFTDDDVLVHPDWLRRVREALADPDVALAGGPVMPLYEGRVPEWLDLAEPEGFGRLASPLALIHYGNRRQPLGPRVVGAGNMAVRRDAFERVGGFNTDLGRIRGTLLSGEDHQLCERIQSAGYQAIWDPAISVRHIVPADRLSFRYFLRWFFWSGVTHAALDQARPPATGHRVLGIPGYLLKRGLVAWGSGLLALLQCAWSRAATQFVDVAFVAGYARASLLNRRSAVSRPRGAEAA